MFLSAAELSCRFCFLFFSLSICSLLLHCEMVQQAAWASDQNLGLTAFMFRWRVLLAVCTHTGLATLFSMSCPRFEVQLHVGLSSINNAHADTCIAADVSTADWCTTSGRWIICGGCMWCAPQYCVNRYSQLSYFHFDHSNWDLCSTFNLYWSKCWYCLVSGSGKIFAWGWNKYGQVRFCHTNLSASSCPNVQFHFNVACQVPVY